MYKITFRVPDEGAVERIHRSLDDVADVMTFGRFVPDMPFIGGEVSQRGNDKGAAMLRLCEALGCTAADCVAFGDSMNDAAILRAAGLGVAMGNADAEVQALADLVCGPCGTGGIAEALRGMGAF